MSVDPPAAEWAILTRTPSERSEVLAADLKQQLGRSEALAEDLKPQSEQVTSLSEHVQVLAAQYEREQPQLAAQVETLTENMVQLGGHVTVLTNAYEGLQLGRSRRMTLLCSLKVTHTGNRIWNRKKKNLTFRHHPRAACARFLKQLRPRTPDKPLVSALAHAKNEHWAQGRMGHSWRADPGTFS